MPLREQDRAVWIGDTRRPIGSSGKVRQIRPAIGRLSSRAYVDWGSGNEEWGLIPHELLTCQQAANRGIEPWAKAVAQRPPRDKSKPPRFI